MELDPLDKQYKYPQKEQKKPESKESRKVVCPNCGHPASANDINIQDKIAKCGSCHEVYSFQNDLQSLLDNTKLKKKTKPKLGKQMDIDILEYKGELSISIINFTDWIALIVFLIAISGLMSSLLVATGGNGGPGFEVVPIAISSAMLLVFSIYRFIKWKDNKSYIDVDDQYLYVKNRPKNFKKDKAYIVSNIRQFYSKVIPGHGSGGNTGYFHVWMIYDGPKGEEHIKVTPYLRSRSRALYLEQELEKYLGLPDEEVPDEFRPSGL